MKRNAKRLIKEVLNCETGSYIQSDTFFEKRIEEIHFYRSELDRAIKKKRDKLFICPFCSQLVRIRGGLTQSGEKKKMGFHFAHLADTLECPIKTNYHIDDKQVDRIKFMGARESLLHFELKNIIAECLMLNEKTKGNFSDIYIENVVKSDSLEKKWKKPDIKSVYNNKKVVFELQLSTTWLGVITERQEFYKENETYIVWLFHNFDISDDTRKLTYNDVIYTNYQNAFVFDNEMYRKSQELNDLVLKVYYNTFYVEGENIENEWKGCVIKFSELKFDSNRFCIYYYNSEADKLKALEELDYQEKKKIAQKLEQQKREIERKKQIEEENKKKHERHYFIEHKTSKLQIKIDQIENIDLPDVKRDLKKIEDKLNRCDEIINDLDSFFHELLKPDYRGGIGLKEKLTLEQELKEICKDSFASYKQTVSNIKEWETDIENRLRSIKNIASLPKKTIGEKNYGILNPKNQIHFEFILFQKNLIKVISKTEANGLFGENYVEPLVNRFSNIDRLPQNSFIKDYYIIFPADDRVNEHTTKIDFLNSQIQNSEDELTAIKKQVFAEIETFIKGEVKLACEQKEMVLSKKVRMEKKLNKTKKKYSVLLNELHNLDQILNSPNNW